MRKPIRAALKGLISGTQGAAGGMRSGWRRGSQSIAGRPGMAWAKGVIGGVRGTAMGIREGWNQHRQDD